VDMIGIEPTTSSMPFYKREGDGRRVRRTRPLWTGGGEGISTKAWIKSDSPRDLNARYRRESRGLTRNTNESLTIGMHRTESQQC
jgi:hypothetical protein